MTPNWEGVTHPFTSALRRQYPRKGKEQHISDSGEIRQLSEWN